LVYKFLYITSNPHPRRVFLHFCFHTSDTPSIYDPNRSVRSNSLTSQRRNESLTMNYTAFLQALALLTVAEHASAQPTKQSYNTDSLVQRSECQNGNDCSNGVKYPPLRGVSQLHIARQMMPLIRILQVYMCQHVFWGGQCQWLTRQMVACVTLEGVW